MEDPKLGSVNFEIQVHSDFYFYFLSLTKIEFSEKVSTAGLVLEGIDFKIVINPKFWNEIKTENYKKNQFLLLHEIYHLILKHFELYKDYDDHTLFNIAADCYINNELINNVLDESYFIEGGIRCEDINVPVSIAKVGTDAVYNYLKNPNNQNDSFKELYNNIENQGNKLVIDHELWKELENSDVNSDVITKSIVSSIESKIKECTKYSSNIGSLPSSLRNIIHDIFNRKESKIDWKKELRNFVSLYSNKIFVKKSFNKPSKFFDDATTIKIKFKPKVAVIIDTSGSMSNNDIVEAFSELSILSKRSEFDVKVIECDANISDESVYDYKNINTIKDRLTKRGYIGGGGTKVDPAILYINKYCPDVASIIYITDGYVDKPEVKPLKPIITILTSNGMELNSFKNCWIENTKILKINEV